MAESNSEVNDNAGLFSPIIQPSDPKCISVPSLENLKTLTVASAPGSSQSSSSYDVAIRSEVPFGQIKDHFTCGICKGVLVDVCTIIECLHSFCRSCILHHIYSSTKCPKCGFQLNEVVPIKDIKADPRMQDLVSTLLPEVLMDETKRRTNYYWEKGLTPPIDKVYIDTHSSTPPTEHFLKTANIYDPSRVKQLHLKSNKVWFKAKLLPENTSHKKFLAVADQFNASHSFIACPAFAKFSALYLAISKKLQFLGTLKLKLVIIIKYQGEIVEKDITVREFFACKHKYCDFPVNIDIHVRPVYFGVKRIKTKAVVCEHEDGSLEDSCKNIFGSMESFFNELDDLKTDGSDPEGLQNRKQEVIREFNLRKRNKSESEDVRSTWEANSTDGKAEDSIEQMRSLSAEQITQIFHEKELIVEAIPVDLKQFKKTGCIKHCKPKTNQSEQAVKQKTKVSLIMK